MKPYCFDIVIPGKMIEFISPNEKDGNHKFHAHLYAKESSIELRIFFGFNTLTPEFSLWLHNRKLEKAFSKCLVTNLHKENNTQKIDFSESKIIGYSQGGNQTENGLGEYYKINLSSVRIYLDSINNKQSTGDFYMNSIGFDLVKDYYSLLSGNYGEFKINRSIRREEFYQFENIKFRPEYEFYTSDVRNENRAFIEKKPKFRFTYPKESTEKEIIQCAEIIRLLGSFYMHNNIEYDFSKIHLQNCTLLIYKSKGKEYKQNHLGLQFFAVNWDFHKLMMSDWQDSAKNNFKLLSKIIPLFVQSMLVDNHSSLLILYNIIEYCMGKFKTEKENFPLVLNEELVAEKYQKAYNLFLETINPKYHEEFSNKWKFQIKKLKLRPEKSLWADYLISKNIILPDSFSVVKIKKIRDCITHGSLNKVKDTDIKRVNTLMYGISGLLILHYLNIHEGSLERIIEHLNKTE
jgi:hypothetical protein